MVEAVTKPAIGSKALRKGRRSVPGEIYFLTTAVEKDFGRLDHPWCFEILRSRIMTFEQENLWQWFGFTLMPDHLHLIVRLRQMNLSEAVRRFKGSTAREINQHLNRTGTVWFDGFYDRMVRSDEPISGYIQYMNNNPVRKGLAANPKDWPYTVIRWEMVTA